MRHWIGLTLIACMTAFPAFAQNLPVVNQDYIIVLDQSGSMREKTPGNPDDGYEKNPLQAHKSRGAMDALNIIVNDMLQNGDYFSLVTFGNSAETAFSQEISFPHERELFRHSIDSMQFGDKNTDILMGMKKATDLMLAMNTPRRKVFILITDGKNEPPDQSPYKTPEAQEEFYANLKDVIKTNKWDMTLVGIGAYTEENIKEIAQKLDLPFEKAIVVQDPQSSVEIQDKLTRIFEEKRDERVLLEDKTFVFEFEPNWRGKYQVKNDSIQLTSSFMQEVTIRFDPQQAVVSDLSDMLDIQATPPQFAIPSQKAGTVNLRFALRGKIPANGRLSGKLIFQLAQDSAGVQPKDRNFDITVKTWAEVYGLYVGLLIAALFIALTLIILAIRKAQVPEIRIEVVAGNKSLGDPMRLKTKQTFTIANGDFGGRTVSAKPLSCKTAATVKYLGKQKFLVMPDEAIILDNGKECPKLQIGLDGSFDLKDSKGTILRGITISTPGKGGGDEFGGSGKSGDPF